MGGYRHRVYASKVLVVDVGDSMQETFAAADDGNKAFAEYSGMCFEGQGKVEESGKVILG